FVITTFLRILTLPAADVVIVVSPPLALGIAAAALRVLKRMPFIFHVQDLQPDAALSLGLLKQGWIRTILFWLERFSYRNAARVSGISHGMLEAFRSKGIAESKLIYFPNGVSIPPAEGFSSRGAFRARQGLGASDFIAVYSGNLGQKQGLEVLIDAGARLKATNVHIFVCGDGARRDALAERVAELGLGNVMLLPLQPTAAYYEMLADADVCVITQEPGTGGAFLPSKLLPALAFGKPVLAVSDPDSELARAVTGGGFGLNITPPNPMSVAAALDELAHDQERLSAFQRAAAQYGRQFEQGKVHDDFAAQLVALLNTVNVVYEQEAVSRVV
ncbi:MAG: glycosyltransferase, partial [Verrucomicrobiota bacterium]|nr:glycosyltransferase [Verrucomicrobiota bacterium]